MENVDGNAERQPDGVAVKLSKPQQINNSVAGAAVFPTEHMRDSRRRSCRKVAAAASTIYDGSDNGQKICCISR